MHFLPYKKNANAFFLYIYFGGRAMHSLSLSPLKVSPVLFQLKLGEFEFLRASRSGHTIYKVIYQAWRIFSWLRVTYLQLPFGPPSLSFILLLGVPALYGSTKTLNHRSLKKKKLLWAPLNFITLICIIAFLSLKSSSVPPRVHTDVYAHYMNNFENPWTYQPIVLAWTIHNVWASNQCCPPWTKKYTWKMSSDTILTVGFGEENNSL